MLKIKARSLLLLTPVFGLILFLSSVHAAQAANACSSTGTGNWSAAGTWTSCGGGIPTSADSVNILTGHLVTVDTAAVASTVVIDANAAAGGNGITIGSGQSLTVGGAVTLNIPTAATTDLAVGAGSLTAASIAISGSVTASRFATVSVSTGTVTVSGSITFSGSAARARYTSTGAGITNIGGDFASGGTLTTTGTGTLNFNGSGTQTMGTYTTYNNVTVNKTGGSLLLSGTTTIGGTLGVTAGTMDAGAFTLTVTGTTTVDGLLTISHVTGSKTFGTVVINNSGIFNFSTAEGVTLNGDLTINDSGAITGTTGTFLFQKPGGGAIGGTSTATQTVGAATFGTSYSNSLKLSVTGTTTATATTITNTGTFTAVGSFVGVGGTFTQGVNGILNIGGTSTITTLNASAVPNEVHYTSTAANQTILGTTYHHLFIEKSGRVGTLGAATTVNGNLTVTAGTLADGGFQITGNASGTLALSANTTLTLGTTTAATSFPTSFVTANITLDTASTVNYNSNLAQTISVVQTYGNLTTTATSAVTKTAADNVTILGNLTNGTNNTLADGGFILSVRGNSTMTGPHTGSGKIVFTGGVSTHSVIGSYGNVELEDTLGVILTGTTTIGGTLTLTTGTWDLSSRVQTVTGATTINSTLLFSSATGLKTFGDIIVNSGGVMHFTGLALLTVNGDLMVSGTGAITGTTGTWTFQKVGGGSIGGTATSLTIAGGNTFATAYSILMPYTVNTLTVNTGVNEINAGTMTVTTSLAGSGTLTQGAGSTLNLGGTVTITTLDASVNSNTVRYTSTTAGQNVKTTDYDDLSIEKALQTAALSGTTNVIGNLTVTSGVLSLGASTLTVTGTTDIHGSIQDVDAGGSATFEGLITVHAGGSWDGDAGESCDFNFMNGFTFNGTDFVSGAGVYTFLGNDQSINGSSDISVQNLAVTGIQLTNSSTGTLAVGTALSGTGEFIQGASAVLNLGGTLTIDAFTATASGNSVSYTGSASQTVKAATYQTLNASDNTNGNVEIDADTTVSSELVLGATMLSTGSTRYG